MNEPTPIDLLTEESVCYDYETKQVLTHHSLCIGNKCAWCMDCGKIVIWFDKTEDFKRLMNPISDE